MARDGKVVIRPDSGDPVKILAGDDEWLLPDDPRTPAQKGLIELLWEEFGGTINVEGFKVLDPHIGAIYGDSITPDRAARITARLADKGFASSNVVFGVGSYSYQYVTRDTFGSAMKATWVEIDGQGRAIQKNPITDTGLKKSATGRLAVTLDIFGDLALIEQATPEEEAASLLQPVWEDGAFVRYQSFADVRAVLAAARD
jgi:nicotinamide phosphoribosyltransferase